MTFSQYVLDAITLNDNNIENDYDFDLVDAIREASDKAPDKIDTHVLEVVAGASSMYYNEKERSFWPRMIMGNQRTFSLEDIDKDDFDILRNVILITNSSYLRTKFSHIVWLLTKDNRYGDMAVNGYFHGFQNGFDPDNWVPCYEQMKRAYHIASTMGKKSESYKKIQSEINLKLNLLNGIDKSFLSLKLLKLIVKDASKENLMAYEPILANIENRSFCATNDDVYFADETFFVLKKLYERLQKNEEIKVHKERYACYYEAQAKRFEQKSNYIRAVVALKKACSLYSDTNREKLLELRMLLEDWEKKSLQEMQVQNFEFDFKSTADKIEQIFDGLSLTEAIIQFGRFAKIYNSDEIKNKLIEDQGNYIFTSMFGSVILNEQGQSVQNILSIREALESGDSEAIEKHIVHYVAEQRRFNDSILVNIAFHFLKKHLPIAEDDLDFLIHDNIIIPENREEIIKQGLCLGLNGKLYAAMHILQPQTENLFRNLVKTCGDPVTFLNDDGTEEYKPLSALFKSEKLRDCYDNNIIFNFYSIMNDPVGENLRNLTAHGLLEPEFGNSALSLYFLSLIIFWLSLYSKKASSILIKLLESKPTINNKND